MSNEEHTGRRPRPAGEMPDPARLQQARPGALRVAIILGVIVLVTYLGSIAWYVTHANG